jgi:hypothetical protein
MGRFVDLCTEIAGASEEGAEGLVLGPEDWERLEQDFTTEEIEDALTIVRESLMQAELTDAADSLSARLVDLLGVFGGAEAFAAAHAGEARLSLEAIGQLARRVARIEEALAPFRDSAPPDRRGFDALQRRLMDVEIEEEMPPEPHEAGDEDMEDEEREE